MAWQASQRGHWCPIFTRDDSDLLQSTLDLREGWRAEHPRIRPSHRRPTQPTGAIFRSLVEGIGAHAAAPPQSFALTDEDAGCLGPPCPLARQTDVLFVIQSRDGEWGGLQYQHETVVVRHAVLAGLTLLMGHPTARGRGGFDIEVTLRDPDTGETKTGPWVPVDYHLSETGAFRLLRVLLTIGELLSVPVRLAEYSDV